MRWAVVLAAVLLTPPAWAETRTFRDDGERTVQLPATISRVFTAGPPAAIALYTFAPDLMLGWPRENRPAEKAFLAEPAASLPATGRLTGRGSTASPEAVIALDPDLILDVGSTRETFRDLAERTEALTGIPYVLLDGRFENTPTLYRTLGTVLNRPERGEALATYAEKTLALIQERISQVPADARPRVYYGRGPDGLETGLRGSINLEIFERMGATNVAATAGQGGLAQVNLEQVLAWDPDVILTVDPNFARTLRTDPRWAGVKAVREGKVFLAPKLPFGWFDFPPGVNRLIGARWLAKALYPAQFPEPLEPQVKEFFKLFYHVDLTDDQVQQLLTVAEADEVVR